MDTLYLKQRLRRLEKEIAEKIVDFELETGMEIENIIYERSEKKPVKAKIDF